MIQSPRSKELDCQTRSQMICVNVKIHTSLRKLVTKSFGLMLLSESHTPSLFILFSITFTVPKAENASWGNTGVLCWSPHANINNLVLNYFSAGNTSSPASPQSLDK